MKRCRHPERGLRIHILHGRAWTELSVHGETLDEGIEPARSCSVSCPCGRQYSGNVTSWPSWAREALERALVFWDQDPFRLQYRALPAAAKRSR